MGKNAALHWGVLGPWDARRQPLAWPRRLLLLGPSGVGDVVAVLPALRLIQRLAPTCQITWLAQAAHQPLVAMMGVTQFRVLGASDGPALDGQHFDAVLAFNDIHPAKVAGAQGLASIPLRIGSASGAELPHWCNHLVFTKRYGWPRHEARRNLRLLIPFGVPSDVPLPTVARMLDLQASKTALPTDLPANAYVVLHPFSAGSAREWPIAHWVDLAKRLTQAGRAVVLTGSQAEAQRLAAVWPVVEHPPLVFSAFGRLNLAQLSRLLQAADAVVAASTGPLHVAAALGTPSLGLFVPRKGLTLDRWAPLGAQALGLQAHQRCPRGRRCDAPSCTCMAELCPSMVAAVLPLAPGAGWQLQAIPNGCVRSILGQQNSASH